LLLLERSGVADPSLRNDYVSVIMPESGAAA
jgi:hypothetical protein